MKHSVVCSALLILTALLMAACSQTASTQGPTTWIDEPLDGAQLPLGPQKLMAHASDADGVANLEFRVNGALLVRSPAGGGVLGDATVGWDPSAPGVYTITAIATDSRGNTGPDATAVVTVGEVEASPEPSPALVPTQVIVAPGTPTHTAMPTGTAMPPTWAPQAPTVTPMAPTWTPQGPTVTPQPPAMRAEIAYFEANPGTINAGGCSTIRWGVDYAAAVYLDGEGVFDHDQRQVCPPTTTTYTLYATSGGGDDTRSVEVTVMQAPTPTPIVSIITPQPIDTTPPDVSNLDADPDSISAAGLQCGGTKTTTVSVSVSDPSGVAGVVAYWTLEYQSGQANMISYGGGLYQVVLGPFDLTGNLAVTVVARDTVNNYTGHIGPTTVLVHCIG